MNRLRVGIFLTFGLALYVSGQSETQSNLSLTGYLYEKPVETLEIPVSDDEEPLSTNPPEAEEVITEEQDDDTDSSEPDYPKLTEGEDTVEREDGGVKNRKREFKNDKMEKNSDGESDIPLRRKNNLHRSHSQESGDKLKRKAVTGSKQKKIRRT